MKQYVFPARAQKPQKTQLVKGENANLSRERVSIITTVHSPFDTRIFHKEARTLAKAGYQVSIIAQHDKCEVIDGIRIIALPKTGNRAYRMLLLTFRALMLALKSKAEYYHIHDPELLPVGVLLKLISGKKVIYDVHEDYEKQVLSKRYLPEAIRQLVASAVRKIERFSMKYFDGIITATDDIYDNLNLDGRVACSVKNFPNLSVFDEAGRSAGRGDNGLSLVYIGDLSEIRGITQMVQAMGLINSYKPVRLALCGRFYPDDYESRVKGLRGYERVEYLGWVPYVKIPRLLASFDAGIVCLHPISNYLTSLPVKLFEYMAAGLPVIASNFPLWKEIVEGNGCGLCVDPLSPREIAGAIEYLSDNPEQRLQMGTNAISAVMKMYNWEEQSEKLLELYEAC